MMSGVNPSSAALDVSKIRAEEGQGCPRCGGKVFMAEEINARGRVSVCLVAAGNNSDNDDAERLITLWKPMQNT